MPLICWKRWRNWFCGVWTAENTHLPWPSPVLIFHLTHTTCTSAFAAHTVPVSTAHLSNLPSSSTCVTPAPGHGMISLWKATRSLAIWYCFTLKINPLHDPWVVQDAGRAAGWLRCCWGHQLSSTVIPWVFTLPQYSSLGICIALQRAEAGRSAEISQLHFPLLQQIRVIPDVHTGAAEKRRIRLITLLTPLLLLQGLFL